MPNATELSPPPLPKQLDPQRPAPIDVWDTVLTGKNLFRAGLALVVLGLIFMFRYAIEAGWIGPLARVGMGGAISFAMLGIGAHLVGIRKGFGTLLVGGGVAGLFVTVYAAFELYQLTSNSVAFIQLVAVSILGVGLALRWDAQALAVGSLTGALAAPLIIPGRMFEGTGDALYFSIVLAAAFALLVFRDWFTLYASTFVLAALVIAFESIRFLLDWVAPTQLEIDLMTVGFGLVFLAGPVLAKLAGKVHGIQSMLAASAAGPVVFGLMSISRFHNDELLAQIAFGLAALHLAVAALLRSDDVVSLVHGMVASGLSVIGATLLLDGPVEVLVLAAIGAALVLHGFSTDRATTQWGGGFLLGIAGFMNVVTLLDLGGVGESVGRVATIAIFGLLAVALDRVRSTEGALARNITFAYAYGALIIIGLVDLAQYTQALTTAVWSLVAVAMIVGGQILDRRKIVRFGIASMAGIIVKVFLVDLATVETIWKMALFMALGVVLLLVGYWISTED